MTDGLRLWQRRCISQALERYAVSPHFFCQATPGAGKTRMAAELARQLFDENKIDLVLCFAPSCQVVEGFRTTFSSVLGRRLDGRIGALGGAYTYQAMEFRDYEFWQLFADHRVLAVFDEIHHCAGSDPSFSNAWGADSTPFGHPVQAYPDSRSTLIRTGSRSAATQGWHS